MPTESDEASATSETTDYSISPPGDDTDEAGIPDVSYTIYECRVCGNMLLGVNPSDGTVTCHNEPMSEVTDWNLDVNAPELTEILLDAFGLPKAGLDICLCVIDDGPLAPQEVAKRLDYDPSTVRRYLQDLVEIGLLQRSQLNREDGGFVNVYHSIDIERMRREALLGLYVWAGRAGCRLEKANLVKQAYFDDNPDDGLNQVFWNGFSSE